MIKRLLFLFFLASIIIVACRPDDDGPTAPLYDGTEYELPTPALFPNQQFNIENDSVTVAGVNLGKHLFYDTRLSIDNSLSCGGCHKQEFAFADEGKAFSVNVEGNPTARNTPSLANLGYMPKIFWDGRVNSPSSAADDALAEEQHIIWNQSIVRISLDPLYHEMFAKAFKNGRINRNNVLNAIGQFMRTLVSYNSKFDAMIVGEYTMTPQEEKGFDLFISEKGDCFHCHFISPLFTDNIFHNNGLDFANDVNEFNDFGLGNITSDPDDYGLFKTPTLRNLLYTSPYMHDGRFQTLDEVIDFYAEGLQSSPTIDPLMKKLGTQGNQLTQSERDDLKAFLLMLNDESFINEPEFSDPF